MAADMPFLSYQASTEDAIRNGGRFLKEGNAEAVKLEGGEIIAETVYKMTRLGIPVIGHLGLTPQSVHQFGGYDLRATDSRESEQLLKDAQALSDAGIFCLFLEKIPAVLAKKVTASVTIPTIGIGAGPNCDGQVLVTHDMLGLFDKFQPKFVRRYANLAESMRHAFQSYRDDVKNGKFPSEKESY
jgi:3-methyl-2-oxobutanoate hydroxymethyltransferase